MLWVSVIVFEKVKCNNTLKQDNLKFNLMLIPLIWMLNGRAHSFLIHKCIKAAAK